MAKLRITSWNGKQLEKLVDTEMTKRLTKAAIHLQNEIKKELSTKGVKCGTDDGERSAPGEPPHLECGQLRNSISYEVGQTNALVGTNVAHGKFLELGTVNMEARPWLRPTGEKNWKQVSTILAGKKIV